MELNLTDKRVILTGGTRGIGRAVVENFLNEGATVSFCSRNPEEVKSVVQTMKTTWPTGRVFGSAVDAANTDALGSWIDRCGEEMGGIDIVIPNVSAGRGQAVDRQAWQLNFEIDLLSVVATVEKALPWLENQGGAVVLISSTAAVEISSSPHPYNAMKAAILNYAKSLAIKLGSKNIRVNSVSPGPIYVEDGTWGDIRRKNPAIYQQALDRIPIGRMGSARDVANAVAFLSSEAASFITGANLMIDGGYTRRVNF